MNDQNPNTKPTEISSSLVVQSETPWTDKQLQAQTQDAFYSNATLDSTNAICVKAVRQLEAKLTAANQALAESQAREAGLREAIKHMDAEILRAGSFYEEGDDDSAIEIMAHLEGYGKKALTSPTPSVVPWSVVERLLQFAPSSNHVSGCLCFNCQNASEFSKACNDAKSYAPQTKEGEL